MTVKTLDDFINLLLTQLGETDKEPVTKIRVMVEKRGPMVAAVAYKLAKEMYDSGAMIGDGSRRRTLGGCFIKCWDKAKREVKARQGE